VRHGFVASLPTNRNVEKKIFHFFGLGVVHVQKDERALRRMCGEVGVMLVMDETTLESWRLGFSHAPLPEDNLLVVASETQHHEKGLHVAGMKHKVEMWTGTLSPTAAAVFRNYSIWLIVLDASPHVNGPLLYNRENLLKKPFIFNQGKGLGNENVLTINGPDAASQDGRVWCLSRIHLPLFADYLGSPDSFAPPGGNELRAFVLRMFDDCR
jgi:hypothetical protein